MKSLGIITFHNSYNCGSMLESYAIQKYFTDLNIPSEIIDFSSFGQRELYAVFSSKRTIKSAVKNFIVFPHKKRIQFNNAMYEKFKEQNFILSDKYMDSYSIVDSYDVVIAGSDQIWNITIPDYDDAYFLNWVKSGRKVAYAPSFGAKNIMNYATNTDKYKKYILDFDAVSVREYNGREWIKSLANIDVPVLIDPTLLHNVSVYENIMDNTNTPDGKYIFFYSPFFDSDICLFVKKVSDYYKLPVITWSTKSYYLKGVYRYGFKLPDYESPAIYLSLIKNASMVFTTSYHGTIFSALFHKCFYTIKNGGMYGDDDRVLTLLMQLDLIDRLIPYDFDDKFDYSKSPNYLNFEVKLLSLRKDAIDYLSYNVINYLK